MRFKTHCRGAIYKYTLEKKSIPLHRQQDIMALENLLNTYEEIINLIESIEKYFTTMKTGWWIFKTGNSKLISLLKAVITYYRNDLQRDTHDSLGLIGEELRKLRLQNEALKQQLEDFQYYADIKKEIANSSDDNLEEGWCKLPTAAHALKVTKPITTIFNSPKHSKKTKLRFWKTLDNKSNLIQLDVINHSTQSKNESRLSFSNSYRNSNTN